MTDHDTHAKNMWICGSVCMLIGYAGAAIPAWYWAREIMLLPLLIGAVLVLFGVMGLWLACFMWDGMSK